MNFFILCIHVIVICSTTLFALSRGLQWLTAWLALLAVAMNLFVLKQITLFGLSVTSSDALAVGYLLGLNLIQEFFGRLAARQCVWVSLFISCGFVILSQIHLLYLPNEHDFTHSHFMTLFNFIPRILLASFLSFFTVQFVDLAFFAFLKKRWAGRYLPGRTAMALILSQTLDTVIFSYLGLYGLVSSVFSIILLSLAVKGVVIFLSTPFVALAKKVVPIENSHVQV